MIIDYGGRICAEPAGGFDSGFGLPFKLRAALGSPVQKESEGAASRWEHHIGGKRG